MGRDPATGRFLPGNKIALGNKGNQNPKWGNKNAEKHGYYSKVKLASVGEDGYLWIHLNHRHAIRVRPNHFSRDGAGHIKLSDYTSSVLAKMGVAFRGVL